MSAFETPPPTLTAAEIETLAEDLFGMKGKARLLNSERDQNARIDADGTSYVLKIANAGEDPAQIALQNATLQHLALQGTSGVPHVIQALDGSLVKTVVINGRSCMIRLVSWLDGPMMSATLRSPEQLHSLGAFMGKISHDLQGFAHPEAFREDFIWSLDHVSNLFPWADDIVDPQRRALVQDLFARYRGSIKPLLPSLRASVLHQDANDNNLITDPADAARV